MSEGKIYALIQWEDLFNNIVDTEKILEPRKPKEDYVEGEYIKARYQGSVYEAVISELGEDRSVLVRRLKEPLKHKFLKNEGRITEEPSAKKKKSDEVSGEQPEPSEAVEPIKKKKLTDEVREAKLAEGKRKRDCTSSTQATNRSLSANILQIENLQEKEAKKAEEKASEEKRTDCSQATNCRSSSDILQKKNLQSEDDIDRLAVLENKVDQLMGMVEKISQTMHCKDCLRDLYKEAKKEAGIGNTMQFGTPSSSSAKESQLVTSPPPRAVSPAGTAAKVPQFITSPRAVSPVSTAAKRLQAFASPQALSPVRTDLTLEQTENVASSSCPDTEDDEANCLVHLGESKYGFTILKGQLEAVTKASINSDAEKAAVKCALNLLDVLLTAEDCINVTVYGNQGKKAMDPKMRRAIRSHLAIEYLTHMSAEQLERFWRETVVYKMNTKIRGIRNGKYSLKK